MAARPHTHPLFQDLLHNAQLVPQLLQGLTVLGVNKTGKKVKDGAMQGKVWNRVEWRVKKGMFILAQTINLLVPAKVSSLAGCSKHTL
jgi:hypothetical protein